MPVICKYRTIVVRFENPVNSIYVVDLKSLDRPFKFLPGQFLHFSLDEYDPSRNWPESRCFSIQYKKGIDRILITFSVNGKYTSRMEKELYEGRVIWVKLPYGTLFNNVSNKDRCVFISGGTGITPFLSLFTDSSFKEYRYPKIYSGFRSLEYNIYNEYIAIAKENNPDIEIQNSYENIDGKLDIAKIFRQEGSKPLYFVSGPPRMVKYFKSYLLENGVSLRLIRTDEWE
jgi:NAD(P)H-flavin reductase